MSRPAPPDCLLLIASGCPHCPHMLKSLSGLMAQGRLARLEIINIAYHPERAGQLGVRSVPWCRIGPFALEGLRSEAELARWSELAGTPDGVRAYVSDRLQTGALAQVEALIAEHPHWLGELLALMGEATTPLQVRIGLSALVEGMSGSEPLRALLPQLKALAAHPDPRVRGDACHFLALTGSPDARTPLRTCLDDADPLVREIAREGIEALRHSARP